MGPLANRRYPAQIAHSALAACTDDSVYTTDKIRTCTNSQFSKVITVTCRASTCLHTPSQPCRLYGPCQLVSHAASQCPSRQPRGVPIAAPGALLNWHATSTQASHPLLHSSRPVPSSQMACECCCSDPDRAFYPGARPRSCGRRACLLRGESLPRRTHAAPCSAPSSSRLSSSL